MNALKSIYRFIADHATKWLGFAQGLIAAICGVTGLIPEGHLKYWMASLAVLTYVRGYFTGRQFDQVKAQQEPSNVGAG